MSACPADVLDGSPLSLTARDRPVTGILGKKRRRVAVLSTPLRSGRPGRVMVAKPGDPARGVNEMFSLRTEPARLVL